MNVIPDIVDTSKLYKIQKTPYFKRLRLRKESDLVHLQQAKDIIEKAAENFLEPQIRQIRLKKLYEEIQHNIEKNEGKIPRSNRILKTISNLNRYRALHAKAKGNEFSQRNRKLVPLAKLNSLRKALHNDKMKEVQITSFNKRKEYGQQVKVYNKQNIECQKGSKSSDKDDIEFNSKNENSRKNDYGQYYNLRNRLNFKHTIKEFDDEYSDLLLQCLLFEKEHLDVCGFLEEQVRSNSSIRSRLMSKLTYSVPSSEMTVNSCTSDSDLISLDSSDIAESTPLSQKSSMTDQRSKSQTSQASKEIFDTSTKISSSDSDKTSDKSTDESISLMKEHFENSTQGSKFVWKTLSSKYINEVTDGGQSSCDDDIEVTESAVENQEKEIDKNNNDMAGPSTEDIIVRDFQDENFDQIVENIISHQGNVSKKSSLEDELSNLFVAYGTKMMKEATNGEIDHNLIKAFALKQQSSIRRALKNITARNF